MNLTTLIGKKNEIFHGTITHWFNSEEFLFIPQGKPVSSQFWCKTDYWKILNGYAIFNLKIN